MTAGPSESRSMGGAAGGAGTGAFDARRIERPDPKLWTYYVITSLIVLPALPIVLPVLYFRYHTLKYRFDDDGISMSVGILFRRETHLTYRRIQDIHLTRGLIQRWLGLATISIQTASGSANAELQIEGVLEADELRDWLYARMRGSHLEPGAAGGTSAGAAGGPVGGAAGGPAAGAVAGAADAAAPDEAARLLEEIRDEIRSMRNRLGSRS